MIERYEQEKVIGKLKDVYEPLASNRKEATL